MILIDTYLSNKKLVISGNIIELYTYENKEILHGYKKPPKKKNKNLDKEEPTERNEDTDRISLSRARKGVRRLINSNANEMSKFFTLTFKENLKDVDQANYAFNKFIKRLKTYLSKNCPEHELKYIAVIEFQKRGAVHYHMLCNLPYIEANVLTEIWSNGFIKINKIDHVDNVGAYVAKYMSKDERDPRLWGKKMYFTSRNLDKPIEVTKKEEVIKITEYLLAGKIPTFTTSFENEYIGNVSYFQYNLNNKN